LKNIISPQYFFRHMISPMESADQQFRQQKENYEHMTVGELCALAGEAYNLTDIGREALQAVIAERGIAVRLTLEPPPPAERPKDDEGLTILALHGWPANTEQARMTMGALSSAGIPSFLGPDNVMHLEEFQGRFDGTVNLKIRDVDQKRAFHALRSLSGDNTEEDPDQEMDYAFLSPKRHLVEGRDLELRERPAPPSAKSPEDGEGLINLGWRGGWPSDAERARLTMGALSSAGIPSFLGPDNVMHLEEFRGRFDGPVSLKIRDVDRKRAFIALDRAADASRRNSNKEKEEDPDEEKDYAILCPKCRSAMVVLEGPDTDLSESPPRDKFQWRCDACGYRWVDDGIVQEVPGGQAWPGEEFPSRDRDSSEERDR
jgi:hypothetical protein